MKTYKKSIVALGITTAFSLSMPLAANEPSSIWKSKSQQDQVQTKDLSTGQRNSPFVKARVSSEIVGLDIKSASNEKIGEVDEVVIDMQSGKIVALVASTGGFLGIDDQSSLLSTDDVRFDSSQKYLRTGLTKAQLKHAPSYNEGEQLKTGSVHSDGTLASATYQYTVDGENIAHSTDNVAITDLVGMSIENQSGEEVGSIDKIYLDLENGDVLGVVVSTGGFLGVGEQQNILALNELKYTSGEEALIVDLDQEQLRLAPVYNEDDTSWYAALRTRADRAQKMNSKRHSSDRTEASALANSSEHSNKSGREHPTIADQGKSDKARQMTSDIRRALQSDEMSNRAKNVMIITEDNKVHICGEVDSAREKASIEEIARKNAGAQNVTSGLVVRAR